MAFGDFVLMRHLSFSVRTGEIFVIMGGSGSGKSTLLRHLIGLHEPAAGDVLYHGQSFIRAKNRVRAQMIRRIGVMYQTGALWSSMTVAENVALPLEQFSGYSREEIARIVSYKLALVGLAGFETFYPSEISGGMVKRASVARALALDPEALFLDEPSAGLDPLSARRMDDLILHLRQSLGMTVVIVTHDLESIFLVGDRAVFLDPQGAVPSVIGDPRAMRNQSDQQRLHSFLHRGDPSS